MALMNQNDRLLALLRLSVKPVTISDILAAGDDAIEATGINPWCVNEGLATGDEEIDIALLLYEILTDA